jgi:hypothetical protein
MTGNLRTSFNEIQLITAEGLRVTAEAAEYYTTGTHSGKTVISFEDFVIPASDNVVDAKIVANIKAYSTAGDTDVVKLGKIKAVLYTDTEKTDGEFTNFKGADSKENLLTVDITSDAQDEVTISAVLVTVSKMSEFGKLDSTAIISFNIDKGNNHIDNDDIHISKIEFEADNAKYVNKDKLRNNDGDLIPVKKVDNDDFIIEKLEKNSKISDNDQFTITAVTT